MPAIIEYVDSKIFGQHWYKNGLKHRDGDFPATELYPDLPYKEYYKNGKYHRDDDALGNPQPALIHSRFASDIAHVDKYEFYKNGTISNCPVFNCSDWILCGNSQKKFIP